MRFPIRLLALAGLLFLVPSIARAAGGTLDPASIREQALPGGLRVIVRESHAANLVSLQYWVRAGVFREDETTSGSAHYLEHLLFKGTSKRPQGGIDAEIEDLGAVLEAETDKDWTTFRVTVATPFWTKAIEVLADMVQHPVLRFEDVEAERRVIFDEIGAARAEPLRVLMNELFRFAMPNSPYRFPTTGSPENVARMKVGPLREYFRKYYTPANSLLIVVGDVTPEAVLQQAKALWTANPSPQPPPRSGEGGKGKPANSPLSASGRGSGGGVNDAPRRHTLPSDFRGGYYGVAFPSPGVRDVPDVYAMDVLVTMLEEGPTGRLPALLRDKARLVTAGYQTLRDPGLLTVMVSTSVDRLDEVEKLVLEEIGRLRAAPPPAAEVEATKRILSGQYALDNETFAGQGKTLGYYAAIDRWQFATSYLENIGKVTPQQVHAAALKYLVPEQATTVILRPRAGGQSAPERERNPDANAETRK